MVLGCTQSVASRSKEGILPICLEYWIQIELPSTREMKTVQ